MNKKIKYTEILLVLIIGTCFIISIIFISISIGDKLIDTKFHKCNTSAMRQFEENWEKECLNLGLKSDCILPSANAITIHDAYSIKTEDCTK